MKTKKLSVSIFKTGLPLFILLFVQVVANAQAPVRASYDSNPYTKVGDNNWQWTGGTARTIYNPLDGGILLKYTMASQGNSDGCSAGAPREKSLFQQACFAHDTNYDAPFPLAGFPGYPDGGSTGQDISDYLLYKDIQLINNNARAKNDGLTNSINDTAADLFYTGVTLGGTFRGKSEGKSIVSKGGAIAVVNNGAYVMTLRVTWNGPDGKSRTVDVTKPSGWTAVVPLSIGATNIKAECWAVGGTNIFTKNFTGPGMYAYTATGTTLIHSLNNGLVNNLQKHINPNAADYKFQVKTADVSGAGTDSNIFFKICGKSGCAAEQVSNPKIGGNAYERNQTDSFTLSGTDVGDLTYIEVRSDTKYAGSDWNVEWIIITKGSKSYVFQTHSWFNNTATQRFNVSEIR